MLQNNGSRAYNRNTEQFSYEKTVFLSVNARYLVNTLYKIHYYMLYNYVYPTNSLFFVCFRESVSISLLVSYYLGVTVYIVFIATNFKQASSTVTINTNYLKVS